MTDSPAGDSGESRELPRSSLRGVAGRVGRFYDGFLKDGGEVLSAAMAYFALFALTPTLMIMVVVVRELLGRDAAAAQLDAAARAMLGSPFVDAVKQVTGTFLSARSSSQSAGVVGAAILLWAIVVGFQQLQRAFNLLWHVRLRDDLPWRQRIVLESKHFVFVLIPAVVALVLPLVGSTLKWASEALTGRSNGVLATLSSPVTVALATWLAVLILYGAMPYAKVRLSDVWLPALVVAVAWTVGTWLFGAYLSRFGATSAVGAAGSVFVLLLWLNYSAQALLLGCAVCRERAERSGGITPIGAAVLVEPRPRSA